MPTRNLTKLEDAFQAIREMEDTLVQLTTQNLDFHRRQIKNAHPSIDDYDYVVRKELRDGLEKRTINIVGGATKKSIGQMVWIRAILPGLQSVGSDVTDNRFGIELLPGTSLNLIRCAMRVKNAAPSSGDYTVNILRSQDQAVTFSTIFDASQVKILNGQHRGKTTGFVISNLIQDDELRYDVVSDGHADGIEIVLLCQVVGA